MLTFRMLTFSMLLCQEAFLLSKTKCTVSKHEMCRFHIQKMWQFQIQKDDHFNIVIRNWKVVWKVVWIKHLLRLNLPLFSSVQVLQSFPWPSGYLHGKKNPLHVKPSYDFLFPEDTSAQATSAYIKCKYWMCWKVRMVKTTVLFICNELLGALIHLNIIILILICFNWWCLV